MNTEQEREAFEAWAGREYRHAYEVTLQDYEHGWRAWQARAALAAKAVPADEPTCFGAGDVVRLRTAALAVFDGPECPQIARDVIEWYHGSLLVEVCDDPSPAPALAAKPAPAPAGWKLVPVEPTENMIHAAHDALEKYPFEGNIRRHYRAMLAAAPTPEESSVDAPAPEATPAQAQQAAAVVTLERMGYEWQGGEIWMPPSWFPQWWEERVAKAEVKPLTEPTPGLLMSMAIRYDHGLGMPGFYDSEFYKAISDNLSHQKRLESTLRVMRQLWEEVAGQGFYAPEKEAHYAALAGIGASTGGKP